MGVRKRNSANKIKEERKTLYLATLNNCPTSPRKMRLLADLIRGKNVEKALSILKFSKQEASVRLDKLVRSAIANWQVKNEGVRIEDTNLYIKSIFVDSARMLKRLRPAPQGRGYRVRKRSNHVTVILDSQEIKIEQNEQLNK
ncbi:MAG: 50S ribosomal protein L22 [Bacteroidota bacterium]